MSREMKHSGAAWIGNIPKHWDVGRYKFCGTMEKGKLPSETNIEGKGLPIIGASEMNGKPPRQFTEEKLPMCTEQDILILWDGANAGLIAHGMCGIVSSTAVVLKRDTEKLNSDYLYYQLKSNETFFRDKVNGTTIPHMNSAYIDELPPLIPPLAEQQAIADFLDKKCNEIDELVSLQEKMIEELKAYKQSVITEAVCKGLNPNAPMKDSEVEWIGDIPEGWKVMKIKHLASVVRGGSPRPAGDPQYYEGNIPFMKVADITKDDNIFVNDCEYTIKEAGLSHTRMIEPHTLLLTNSGATLGVPKINTFKTTFNDGIAAFLDLDKSLDIYFAYYSLKARTKYFLDSASLGIGQPNLNTDIIGSTYLAIPHIEEQYDIVEFLNTKCSEIDQLISIKQQKIVELKDYKKSLIYEYTTGKKEVKL